MGSRLFLRLYLLHTGLLKAGVSFTVILPGCAMLGVVVTLASFIARVRLAERSPARSTNKT